MTHSYLRSEEACLLRFITYCSTLYLPCALKYTQSYLKAWGTTKTPFTAWTSFFNGLKMDC